MFYNALLKQEDFGIVGLAIIKGVIEAVNHKFVCSDIVKNPLPLLNYLYRIAAGIPGWEGY